VEGQIPLAVVDASQVGKCSELSEVRKHSEQVGKRSELSEVRNRMELVAGLMIDIVEENRSTFPQKRRVSHAIIVWVSLNIIINCTDVQYLHGWAMASE